MCMAACKAERPWLVHIFDVARSLLMCCSLVASVRQKLLLPLASVRLSGDPSRHLAYELVPCGEKTQVRSSVTKRAAEARRLTDGDIRAKLRGRF